MINPFENIWDVSALFTLIGFLLFLFFVIGYLLNANPRFIEEKPDTEN